MGLSINRVMAGFLAAFFALVAVVAVYEVVWDWPGKRCINAHKWWDPYQRVCATPINLPLLTGRPNRPVAPH